MGRTAEALIVQDWRGSHQENSHMVDVAIVSNSGESIAVWGDEERKVIPRSAIKSSQALPLVMSGAAAAFSLTDDELALACASHGGEPGHVDAVFNWLLRIGRSAADLECGPSDPIDHEAMVAVYRRGEAPGAIHNCCSGKHSGFLTTAVHLGADHRGYVGSKHPIQQRVTRAQEVMTGTDLSAGPVGIDGCGIPVFAFPLHNLALSMARLVAPHGVNDDYATAASRIAAVLVDRPWFVAGTNRPVVSFTEASREPIVAKSGADGVYMLGLPQRGIGVALKARSGSNPAAVAATDWVLRSLEVFSEPATDAAIYNRVGAAVGKRIVVAT